MLRTGALIAVLTGLLVLTVAVFWRLPRILVPKINDVRVRFEMEDTARRSLAQLVAGILVLAGVYVSWQTFAGNRRDAAADRLARGVQLLAQCTIEERVGGILILGQVLEEYPRNAGVVRRELSAFVQAHLPKEVSKRLPPFRPDRDIEAAMDLLIASDARSIDLSCEDLRDRDLRGLRLIHGDLTGAQLANAHLDETQFDGANLTGANLQNAILYGTDLRMATLKDANLDSAELNQVIVTQTQIDEACGVPKVITQKGGTRLAKPPRPTCPQTPPELCR